MSKLNLKIAAGAVAIGGFFLFFAGFSQEETRQKPADTEKNNVITAIPIQLGRDTYGVAMIDTERETLWIYEFNTRGQTFNQLRLIAARSFEYDRKLTEWNTAPPTPTQVKQLVESIQVQQQDKQQKQEQKIEELQQLLEQE